MAGTIALGDIAIILGALVLIVNDEARWRHQWSPAPRFQDEQKTPDRIST